MGTTAHALFLKVPALFSCLFDPLTPHRLSYRCCNTCEDVREAYRRRGWAFKNPDTIEQCRREGFSQKMQEQKNEGCQVYGFLEVNKVQEGPRQGRASWAVGWPYSTVNRGSSQALRRRREETAGELEGISPTGGRKLPLCPREELPAVPRAR